MPAVFFVAAGANYPEILLYSSILFQSRIVSLRDEDSMLAMESFRNFSFGSHVRASAPRDVLSRSVVTADLIASAPQAMFHYPPLDFSQPPRPLPPDLAAAISDLDEGGNYSSIEQRVDDIWRSRYPICWLIKANELHMTFVQQMLKQYMLESVDKVLVLDGNEGRMAKRYLPEDVLYVFDRNTTHLARLLRSNCKMVVSMALHGAIYAVRLGIPAFGLRAAKISGALKHFGGQELMDACSSLDEAPTIAAIVRCHMKYDTVKTWTRVNKIQRDLAQLLLRIDSELELND